MQRLRIGLIGWGTVGAAFGHLVRRGPLPVELTVVAVRDPSRERVVPLPEGVTLGPPERALEGVDAVVELAGGLDGPDRWSRMALARGLPYVTANKALLATAGDELAELATEHEAALLASASVGGGTPMIEFLAHLAASGEVERLRGVVNATTTYILSAMGAGRSYDEALREAQAAGYAEADPSFDVEGRDAAQKLAVLGSVAWGRWRGERQVDASGIVGVEVQPGRVVRLVGEATEALMRVRPVELERDDALARTAGIENLLEVEVREAGTFRISGPGAGGRVTAGAVYADVARLVAGERPILFARVEAAA
ncbi:MAG TPA: homoserine dehydrogenase [Candidatus Limnocylindria bacterium]|nr:homoserine dehydrogenase [Candidatus Limnocylindria bacterium]